MAESKYDALYGGMIDDPLAAIGSGEVEIEDGADAGQLVRIFRARARDYLAEAEKSKPESARSQVFRACCSELSYLAGMIEGDKLDELEAKGEHKRT